MGERTTDSLQQGHAIDASARQALRTQCHGRNCNVFYRLCAKSRGCMQVYAMHHASFILNGLTNMVSKTLGAPQLATAACNTHRLLPVQPCSALLCQCRICSIINAATVLVGCVFYAPVVPQHVSQRQHGSNRQLHIVCSNSRMHIAIA